MTDDARTPRPALAIYSFFLAAVVGFVAFRVLPVRVAAVDAVAGALLAIRVASGLGLLHGSERGRRLAIAVAIATLVVGMIATTLVAASASIVAGIYDSVGKGSAVVFALGVLLFVPYLVVFPALELRALVRQRA